MEVIGSNPIAPTIFSITCKRPCCFRGSIWVQQAHNTALGLPFRWRHRLHIMIHRHADICMAHERLHNSHIFPVSLQPSTERMAKRQTGAFELDRKRCRFSAERLLVAECDKGIHLSSAARGHQAGGETDKRNDDYHRDERP